MGRANESLFRRSFSHDLARSCLVWDAFIFEKAYTVDFSRTI